MKKCFFSLDDVWLTWAFLVARKRVLLKGLKLWGVSWYCSEMIELDQKGIRNKAALGPGYSLHLYFSQVICFYLDSFPLSTSCFHILRDFGLRVAFWLASV